jgi:hypothetical protein
MTLADSDQRLAAVQEALPLDTVAPQHGARTAVDASFNVETAPLAESAPSAPVEAFTDDALVAYIVEMQEERTRVVELLDSWIGAAKREIEMRLQQRGARALPHKDVEIELEEEFTKWSFDLDALRAAAALLPDDERVKILHHIPEQTYTVTAHDEAGNPRSIAALQRKYGVGNPVGDALARAMKRTKVGEHLIFKPRKG